VHPRAALPADPCTGSSSHAARRQRSATCPGRRTTAPRASQAAPGPLPHRKCRCSSRPRPRRTPHSGRHRTSRTGPPSVHAGPKSPCSAAAHDPAPASHSAKTSPARGAARHSRRTRTSGCRAPHRPRRPPALTPSTAPMISHASGSAAHRPAAPRYTRRRTRPHSPSH